MIQLLRSGLKCCYDPVKYYTHRGRSRTRSIFNDNNNSNNNNRTIILNYINRFVNGDVYEGEFKENVPFGKGNYIYKDGGADEANWEHGVRHGLARYNSIDGTVEEVFYNRRF